jgi:hypothetical protein
MWDALRLDVRHSFRSLRRAPAFSLIVIATLALAVGATAALGSMLNALVLRRLAVPSPGQLVALSALEPLANVDGDFYVDTFNAYRATQRSFAQMSMYSGGGLLRVVTHAGVFEDASTEAVSPSCRRRQAAPRSGTGLPARADSIRYGLGNLRATKLVVDGVFRPEPAVCHGRAVVQGEPQCGPSIPTTRNKVLVPRF